MVEHCVYLEFIVSGDPSEPQWIALMHDIVEPISKTGKSRIFVDLSGISNAIDPMNHYRMGIRAGATFGIRACLAALRPVWDDDNFWETVATNRAAIAKSGDDRMTLLNWLTSDA
ncbi:hypothetical protein [Bremerella volcania]|nr:hypothetical protein [Bremerella volcania]